MGAALLFEVSLLVSLLSLAAWLFVPRCVGAACRRGDLRAAAGLAISSSARATPCGTRAPAASSPARIPPKRSSPISPARRTRYTATYRSPLARPNLKPVERARLIVEVAARLKQDSSGDRRWIGVLVAPITQGRAAFPRRLAAALPASGPGLRRPRNRPGKCRRVGPARPVRARGNGVATSRCGAPRRHASGKAGTWTAWSRAGPTPIPRRARGWPGRLFPRARSTPRCSCAFPRRARAAVIEREISRAADTRVEHYDRVIEAALGLPPAHAFALLQARAGMGPRGLLHRDSHRAGAPEGRAAGASRALRTRSDRGRALPRRGPVAHRSARALRLEREVQSGVGPPGATKMWSSLASTLEAGAVIP